MGILWGSFLFSQTGNVGVNTDKPTENFDVNGVARIRNIPKKGTANSIFTKEDGTASDSKNQTFTPVNTLVVDKNGVVGILEGLPDTSPTTPTTPEVKNLKYTSITVPIDANTAEASIVTLGDVSIRFNANEKSNAGKFLEFRLNNFSDVSLATTRIAGSGGMNFGDWDRVESVKGNWYKLSTGQVTINNEDLQTGWLNLLMNKQLYRVTVSMSKGGTTKIPDLPTYPKQVTLFVEALQ